jgi:hypothetical protein
MGRREGRAAGEVLRCCAQAGLRIGRGGQPVGGRGDHPCQNRDPPGTSHQPQMPSRASTRGFFAVVCDHSLRVTAAPLCVTGPRRLYGDAAARLRYWRTTGLQHWQQSDHRLRRHRQGGRELGIFGRRQLQQCARRKRSHIARQQHGRIANLRHQQQPAHWLRLRRPGLGFEWNYGSATKTGICRSVRA